jgi:hypothetical protein
MQEIITVVSLVFILGVIDIVSALECDNTAGKTTRRIFGISPRGV